MPWNLLLLPLAGGYVFNAKFNRLRYFSMRVDGYRILFNSAVTGAVLLCIASLVVVLVQHTTFGEWLEGWRLVFAPFDYSGRAFLAFLLGSTGWWLLNLIPKWSEDRQSDYVIDQKRDALEILLRRAIGERRLILMTMANGKVYVAKVTQLFNPAFPLEYIVMLPVRSGYRAADDKQVTFTQSYETVLAELQKGAEEKREQVRKALPGLTDDQVAETVEKGLQVREFELVIPKSQIQSVCFFDKQIFDDHFSSQRTHTSPASVQT